jgi:AcrR family transcriptional regulator
MTTRSYNSPRREQAALATRSAIVDAAERLYVERGYAATRLSDIAASAKVSLATVKNAYGTKLGLLQALVRARVVGDGEGASRLDQRDEWTSILEEQDPARLLKRFITLSADIHARSAGLIDAIIHGAAADPELAEMARIGSENRRRDLEQVIVAVERLAPLRDELTTAQAVDVLWMLTSPTAYQQLVGARRWSPEQWTAFTTRAVLCTLLGNGPRG